MFTRRVVTIALAALAPLTTVLATAASPSQDRAPSQYLDRSDGHDWPGYGRTFGQQHYSPLTQVNASNVSTLGLAWSMDLEPLKNSATQPIAVDGVLYFATGLSVVHAVDAETGQLLWRYDPKAAEAAALNLRSGWGVRGISWWNGKIYTGTQDGRLIAIDARSGKPIWSVQTFEKDYPAHINGAPRVFDGKVIVGYASSTGATRGYVTTYDAQTGKKLWRFYTVPGNPAEGFEDSAMEMAAKSWAGQWWKFGGGANVWNAIAYDPETDTVFIGTGSGYPWNRRVRSADQGDNLFVASIVALQGATGKYQWHYQVNPGDTWDYDATMDIELAELTIAGRPRKVLLQAPKNGFFYVIDRSNGKLISAAPYAKVTWAKGIDPANGRPLENPGMRYPQGAQSEIWPWGGGAHSWMPMAYSPLTQLAYIPAIEIGLSMSDRGIDLSRWRPPGDRTVDGAVNIGFLPAERRGSRSDTPQAPGALVAWNPLTQSAAWKVPHATQFNGGILATGGGLVFQGTIDGRFTSYSATSGQALWSFDAHAPLIATPISYLMRGKQYVTLLTGLGMGNAILAGADGRAEKYRLDARSQARRVLTFKLGGQATLSPMRSTLLPVVPDPEFKHDARSAASGQAVYGRYCAKCHGASAIAVMQAPDLRRSGVLLSAEAFKSIVHHGGLVANGMPAFSELTDRQLEELRQYLRTEARRMSAP